MAVPNIFGTATAAIPLSQLDSNFATTITLGNTAIQLGNTVTTLNNMTLANVTVSSGSVTLTNVAVTTANVTTANITTAVIGTATITTVGITTANATTANIVTAVITTANVTTANVNTALSYSGTLTGGTGIVNLGSGQFYKDATGNVGIGTNSPQAKLTVNGALPAASSPATYAGTIQINETALSTLQDTGGLEFRGAVFGSGYGNKITSTDTGDLLFGGRLNSASWTERMRIDSSGNVGIGTASPDSKLVIQGGSGTYAQIKDGTVTTFVQARSADLAGVVGTLSNHALAFWTNSAERARIDSSGIVTMSAYGAGAATFSAAGVISSVSDETWKIKDGVPVDTDAMLKKLEPGYWYYNDEKKETFGVDRQLGFYAQNVNAAIGPEAAPEPEEGKPWGYYDRSVLAVTVMSLQKALATIESLTARIAALEAK